MMTTTSEHADRGGSQQDLLQEADQHNAPHREEPQQEEPHREEPRNATFQHDGDGGAQFTGGHHGDIYQIYASMERSENVVRRMLGRRVAPSPMNPDSVHRLERVFCPPEHYDVALATLRNSNAVVITGARGSGRHSAAMKLLSEVAESSHDLSNEADEEDLLDPEAVGVGEGLLLDLSARSLETVEALLRRWEPLRAKVAAKKCFSVIVLAENAQHLLASDLRGHLVTIGHPDSSRVLAQHLAWQGVLVNESDLDSAQLPPRLQRMSMGELSALAGLVRETRGAGEVLERLQQALEASKPRPEHVTTWLRKHVDRREHALMLSAAVLAGAHTDDVFAASEDLRGVVDPADDEGNPLEREGISDRLSKVGIGVDDDRSVQFGTLDFDHQVRTYFWHEHPELRGELRDWVGRAASRPELDERSRNELVFRFAEQALAAGRPRDLSALVEQWVRADGGPSARMLGCVGLLLRIGLLDERFGGWFRQRVYAWARRRGNAGLPARFDLVLITLCERVIAPSLPDRALVRLHHFARRDDEQVAGEAARRIEVLAAEPIFFRRALHRLVHDLQRTDEDSNAALFLRIVDPQRLVPRAGSDALLADRGVRDQLVSGWRSVLGRPVSTWQPRVRDWLQAEADDPGCTDLVDVLVEAADRRAPVLGGLHGVARRWADEATEATKHRRRLLVAHLLHRIDTAQNLEFLTKTGEAAR